MPSEERFAVVRKYLETHGWALQRITGSHHIFTKSGSECFSVPVHGGKVKPQYVRRIKKTLIEDFCNKG